MKKKILLAVVLVAVCVTAVFALTACNGKGVVEVGAQIDTLKELNSKTADVAIIDSVMAGWYTKAGNEYADKLMIVPDLALSEEFYGIGFRFGSTGLERKVQEALYALQEEGTLTTIVARYGLQDSIVRIPAPSAEAVDNTDWNYIQTKGEMVIGYTEFAPIAYYENDVFKGFDTDLAIAVCEKLGITPKFTEINWKTKEVELSGKTIDCIWNGFTISEDKKDEILFSVPYLTNRQVAVIRKEDADKFKTKEDLKNAVIAVEEGSAGADVAFELKK